MKRIELITETHRCMHCGTQTNSRDKAVRHIMREHPGKGIAVSDKVVERQTRLD